MAPSRLVASLARILEEPDQPVAFAARGRCDVDTQRFPRVLLAVSLLGLASFSLVGCNNESRYCDDTGCYFCDGLGCRLVNPPTRTTCACATDCGSGSSCTSLGCTQTCVEGTICSDGTACRSGFCLGPREPLPTAQDCTCTTTAECSRFGPRLVCLPQATGAGRCGLGCTSQADCTTGNSCVNGMCMPNQTQVGCDATHPCATGSTCVGGSCVPDAQICQFSTECGAGRICVNQQCTAACSATNPCVGSATCGADGFCHEVIPPPTGCSTATDCASGQTCVDGRCFSGCAVDSDCPHGDYCDAGVCRLDTRTNPACGNGRPCASGSVCHNGACRSPCTQDAQCPLFDVQTNFCIDMVCATTNEATSNCASAADCMGGEICVDGNCRH